MCGYDPIVCMMAVRILLLTSEMRTRFSGILFFDPFLELAVYEFLQELLQTHMGQCTEWTSTVPVIGAQFRVHVVGSKTLF